MTKMVEASDWMSYLDDSPLDNSNPFQTPLWDFAIPGSHHSMTYCLDICSELEPNFQYGMLNKLGDSNPRIINPYVMKWATVQKQTIVQQLEAGVRFFDLRIACKPSDDTHTLYFAYGLYTTVTVEETFKDVAQWLTQHPKEVIILACSSFNGLDNDDHQNFIAQLNHQLFPGKLCPNTVTPTLQLCLDEKYQVILSYDHDAALNNPSLWPKIDQWWANKTSACQVMKYLDNRLQSSGRDSKFFVAGLNLTEDAEYVLGHPFSSLREITLQAHPALMGWVKRQHCGQGNTCINIIAADFVGKNDFVKLVYQLNWKKWVG